MYLTKKQNRFLILLILILLGVFLVSFIIGSVIFHLNPISVRFFADIEKFEKLNDIVTKDIPLSEDKKLEDLKVISSYTKEIKYNGQKYKVYAYVFESAEMAASYFKKATGKKTKGKYNFTCSTNHYFGSEIIAFNENCLYLIEGGDYLNFSKVVNYICSDFEFSSQELYEAQKAETQ